MARKPKLIDPEGYAELDACPACGGYATGRFLDGSVYFADCGSSMKRDGEFTQTEQCKEGERIARSNGNSLDEADRSQGGG